MHRPTVAMVIGLMLTYSVAHADGQLDTAIERPLVLPAGTVEPTMILGITNGSQGDGSVTGEAISAALDIGVARNLQVGLYASIPVNPAAFGSILGNAQYGLNEAASLR